MLYRYLSCSLMFFSASACFANAMPLTGAGVFLFGLAAFCANVVLDSYAGWNDEAA